jgi:uncharacterized protein (DUF2141 family)
MTISTNLQKPMKRMTDPFVEAVRRLKLVALAVVAFSSTLVAQTFPTNCSSKDLDAIEAILQGGAVNSLLPGNRKISLTIANKTTSDRRAFVMWAKMNRYDINGVLKETRNIAFGVDSVKKSATMTLTSRDSLYFGTDDMIELTNIYTAWSSKTTDDITYLLNNSSKIAPNCAVKNPIKMYTGVNARFFTEKAACANGKGVIKTRPFGGKAPYTVSVSQSGTTTQTSTTVTNDLDSVLSSLPPGIYKVTVVDAKYNSSVFTREILAPDGILKPSFSVTHPNCTVGKGQIKVINYANGTKYDLVQNGTVILSSNTADLSNVDPGGYKLVASLGVCVNADSAKVNNRPPVPGKPVVSIGHPSCDKPRGWMKVTNTETDVTYQLTQSGNGLGTDASGNFTEVDAGSYVVVAKGNICNTNSDGLTVNPRPSIPNKPDLDITHPNCNLPKGLIKVKNPQSNVNYQLSQLDNTIKTDAVGDFIDVESGAYVIVAAGNVCKTNSDTAKVNNRPRVPNKPTVDITHPNCELPKGLVKVKNKEEDVTYDLLQGSTPVKSDVAGDFSEVDPGDYQILAKGPNCNANSDGVTVNPRPHVPGKPDVDIVHPNCSADKGKVNVKNKDNNVTYTLYLGTAVAGNSTTGDFGDVEPGDYIVTAVGKSCKSNSDNAHVNNRPFKPAEPKFSINHPTCKHPKGYIILDTTEENVAYYLDLSTGPVSPVNGGFADLEPGDYTVMAQGQDNNGCKKGKGGTINPAPLRPHEILAEVTSPDDKNCALSGGITITSWKDDKGQGYSYYLVGVEGTEDMLFANEGLFTDVDPGTYQLYAIRGICSISAPFTIGQPEGRPDAVTSVSLTQPTFCKKGTIKINGYGNDVYYSKDGFATYQDSSTFAGIQAEEDLKLWVKFIDESKGKCPAKFTGDLCPSSTPEVIGAAATASKAVAAEQTAQSASSSYLGSANLGAAIDVKTIPNPFASKVRFVISAEEGGRGVLELFNLQGQKIKTIYEGYVNKGTNFFDLTLPNTRSAELIYVLRIGDSRITGKLIQTGNKN